MMSREISCLPFDRLMELSGRIVHDAGVGYSVNEYISSVPTEPDFRTDFFLNDGDAVFNLYRFGRGNHIDAFTPIMSIILNLDPQTQIITGLKSCNLWHTTERVDIDQEGRTSWVYYVHYEANNPQDPNTCQIADIVLRKHIEGKGRNFDSRSSFENYESKEKALQQARAHRLYTDCSSIPESIDWRNLLSLYVNRRDTYGKRLTARKINGITPLGTESQILLH